MSATIQFIQSEQPKSWQHGKLFSWILFLVEAVITTVNHVLEATVLKNVVQRSNYGTLLLPTSGTKLRDGHTLYQFEHRPDCCLLPLIVILACSLPPKLLIPGAKEWQWFCPFWNNEGCLCRERVCALAVVVVTLTGTVINQSRKQGSTLWRHSHERWLCAKIKLVANCIRVSLLLMYIKRSLYNNVQSLAWDCKLCILYNV